jgi:hypothetical protein
LYVFLLDVGHHVLDGFEHGIHSPEEI